MTTIAWDGRVLVADSRVTGGNNCVCGEVTKAWKSADGYRWAHTGGAQDLDRLRRWTREGRGDNPPLTDEHDGCLVRVSPDGELAEWWGRGWLMIRAPFQAWGSGERLAIGAMAAGASAERAVEIACRFDPQSGGEITVLRREA